MRLPKTLLLGAVVCPEFFVPRDRLEEFDPGVKEAASLALRHIARHNEGARSALTLCIFLL